MTMSKHWAHVVNNEAILISLKATPGVPDMVRLDFYDNRACEKSIKRELCLE
jgi:hypothetical protein